MGNRCSRYEEAHRKHKNEFTCSQRLDLLRSGCMQHACLNRLPVRKSNRNSPRMPQLAHQGNTAANAAAEVMKRKSVVAEAPARPRMARAAKATARLARLEPRNLPTSPFETKPYRTNLEASLAWSKSRLEPPGQVTSIGTAHCDRKAPMGSCRA